MRIRGFLDPYFETGTEGVWWALVENGKLGYEALVIIKSGDHLIIHEEDGSEVFNDYIIRDTMVGWTEYPNNLGYGQPVALGYWIHWTQRGWAPDDWATLFFKRLTATLTRIG